MAEIYDGILVLSGGGRNLINVRRRDLEYYSIPVSVTSISKKAFKGCSSLYEINVPGNVKNIGVDAFMDCSSLSVVKMSEGVTRIGKGAFRNCTSLREIVFPESLKIIDAEAFSNCPSIRRIKISEGATTIGTLCFANCKSLEIVVLPDSITSLGESCFKGCGNLKKVFFRKQDPSSLTIENTLFDFNNHVIRILYVPSNVINSYKNSSLINYFKYIESEENPELTDWDFSDSKYDYVSKDTIADLGIPGLILLKLAGKPDKPSINQYLKSRIDEIKETEEYLKYLDIYHNGWSVMELRENGWTINMIKKYAGNPNLDLSRIVPADRCLKEIYDRKIHIPISLFGNRYKYLMASNFLACISNTNDKEQVHPIFDFINEFLSKKDSDYEYILEYPFFWPYIFYLKSTVSHR